MLVALAALAMMIVMVMVVVVVVMMVVVVAATLVMTMPYAFSVCGNSFACVSIGSVVVSL